MLIYIFLFFKNVFNIFIIYIFQEANNDQLKCDNECNFIINISSTKV